MTPNERRQAIVEATWPLLLEKGPELTTKEIAAAAGVAEGTIFRAFETKHDIIHAAIFAAIRPTVALQALAELDSAQTLEQRVVAVTEVLIAELDRTKALFVHLAGVGIGHGRPHPPMLTKSQPQDRRAQLLDGTAAALVPYVAELRVSADVAAKLLNALAFASSFGVHDDDPPNPQSMAQLVLHGIAEGEK
jgi:AcrR family transcriptional regulator